MSVYNGTTSSESSALVISRSMKRPSACLFVKPYGKQGLLSAVNLEDAQLCESDLFPRIRQSKPLVDFFLSKVVFPKEGKEFRSKISCSGWDIPARAGGQRTTGFSGTNDSQSLLPLSIEQRDLTALRHTNAMVLSLLLHETNRRYLCASGVEGNNLSVSELLRLISSEKPATTVLIDVGAQILEMENQQVVQTWLDIVPSAKGAVFFDANHVARLVDREGNCSDLVTSPFHRRLQECLIYFDEAHTRGIDLTIPLGARAAVTLGPRLTKDKLVQGLSLFAVALDAR